MKGKFYAIVPPVSPWDEKHKELIHLDHARRTIGATPGEAWNIQCRRGLDALTAQETSRRVQYWMDIGYRLVEIELAITSTPPRDDVE